MNRFIWIVLNLLPFFSFGQQAHQTVGSSTSQLVFEHYSQGDGLSQGSGYASAHFDGFMWLGTQDGLNRFDQNEFKVYKDGALNSNYIQTLLNDQQGHLWIGTSRGLAICNQSTFRIQKFSDFFGKTSPLDYASVRQLYRCRDGSVWILTDGNGLHRYNPKGKSTESFPHFSNKLSDITEGKGGEIYIATDDDVFRFESKTRRFSSLHIKSTSWFPESSTIRAVLATEGNRLWVGTYEHGLYLCTQVAGSLSLVSHFQEGSAETDISSNEITRLMQDSKGKVWVGTRTGGVSLYSPVNKGFLHLTHTGENPNSLAENYVLSFAEDVQNNIWVGLSGGGFDKFDPGRYQFGLIRKNDAKPTASLSDNMVFKIYGFGNYLYFGTQTGGLTRYDPVSKVFKVYKNEPGNPGSLPHNEVYDITSDESGKLWLALGKGLCRFDPVTQRFESFFQSRESGSVYLYASQVIKSRNEVWAGGQRGLNRFDIQTKKWLSWDDLPAMKPISKYVIRLIYEDSESNIWLGTTGQGLFRYSFKTGILTHVNKAFGLDCANIRSIFEDDSSFWIGTDCGVYVFDQKLKLKDRLDSRDGLPNNVVYGILKSADGHYWLSTNEGITYWSSSERICKTFRISDGLQSNEFNTNCMYKAQDGTMYFGGVNGISYFKPRALQPNTFVPPVRITKITVQDSVFAPEVREMNLFHHQNFINFEFVALNFSDHQKNEYRYRMEGIDAKWINAGTKRAANYTNLPPGNYVFRVTGSNNDGLWNKEGAMVKIYIQPPWWGTGWFRLSLILLLISGIYGLLRYRLTIRLRQREAEIKASLMTQEAERQRFSRELHDGVGANLSLLKMYLSSFGNEQIPMTELKERSQKLLATSMDEIRRLIQDMHPQNLKQLGLECAIDDMVTVLNLGVRFTVTFKPVNIPARLPETVEINVFRIIQELLHNAVKHANALHVVLDLRYHQQRLTLIYTDDGTGFDTTKFAGGNGLLNIRNRAALLKGDVQVRSVPGTGTTIRVDVGLG
ncbi:sensor histidine kinase [Dyadobacter sp. CY312]|uniref:sensor histidine kinase n=1 Tax=Dyadobacter sp. CY312 TaxID=2907303 RepID=UPI001F1ABFCB|nr:sensor histidine kinase [Dyadobacter sp. CY312]MCE7040133.1 histidine kinase [Dyadobacter sp. CY312]